MSAVDPEVLDKFKNFSSDWWNKTGPLRVVHDMSHVKISLVLDGLVNIGIISKEVVDKPAPFENLMILEAGCAGGVFAEDLTNLGGTVTGIDPCPEQIQQAKQHAALNPSLTNLSYCLESIEEHAANNHEKYDVVISTEVLEHVFDQKKYLEACVKCLKPGGSIFITTENKNIVSWFGAIFLGEYVFGYIPRGAFNYHKFISPGDTQTILESCKCQTKSVRGMYYNPFKNTWNWTWHSLVHYGLHAVKSKI